MSQKKYQFSVSACPSPPEEGVRSLASLLPAQGDGMIPDDLGAGGYIVKVARKLAENSIFVTDDIFQAFVGLDPYPQPLGVDACERIVKSPLPAVCLVGVTDVRPKPFGPGHISNSLLSSSP